MLSLTLALVISAQAPDLNKKVTFTSVAKPAKAMLADLSEPAGITLTASQAMENEILVLSVKDVPVAEIMKRVASAAAGEWQQEGTTYRLIRSAAKDQELRREELAKRTALLQKALDELIAKTKDEPFDAGRAKQIAKDLVRILQNNPTPNQYNASITGQMNAVEAKSPVGRLQAKLLRNIDIQVIARMKQGQRLVFSTAPNSMQTPFLNDPSTATRAFTQEHAVWSDAAKQVIEETGYQSGMWNSLQFVRPIEGAAKALLSVSAGEGGSMFIETLVGDSSGRLIGRANASLAGSQLPQPNLDDLRPTDEQPIELSPTSEALAKVLRTAIKKQGLSDLGIELRRTLADTDKNDPMSFIASDSLIGWAKAKKLNLVASLPDSAAYKLGILPGVGNINASSVQRILNKIDDLVVTTGDGWAELHPTAYIEVQESRVDRKALGQLLLKGVETARLTLDDKAAYALTEKGITNYSEMTWFMMAMLMPALSPRNGEELPMLRLYGSLSAQRRQDLKAGGKFLFSQLSQQQRAYVETLVYGDAVGLMVRPPKDAGQDFYLKAYGIGRDPTEAMPNGLPPASYLTMSFKEGQTAYGYISENDIGRIFDPENLAWDLVARESPDKNPWVQNMPPYNWFRVAEQIQVEFALELTPIFYVQKQLQDNYLSPESKKVTFDQLPATFKDKTLKLAEEYRKSNVITPSQAKPPPPR